MAAPRDPDRLLIDYLVVASGATRVSEDTVPLHGDDASLHRVSRGSAPQGTRVHRPGAGHNLLGPVTVVDELHLGRGRHWVTFVVDQADRGGGVDTATCASQATSVGAHSNGLSRYRWAAVLPRVLDLKSDSVIELSNSWAQQPRSGDDNDGYQDEDETILD